MTIGLWDSTNSSSLTTFCDKIIKICFFLDISRTSLQPLRHCLLHMIKCSIMLLFTEKSPNLTDVLDTIVYYVYFCVNYYLRHFETCVDF